jgi:hypothetical protein
MDARIAPGSPALIGYFGNKPLTDAHLRHVSSARPGTSATRASNQMPPCEPASRLIATSRSETSPLVMEWLDPDDLTM